MQRVLQSLIVVLCFSINTHLYANATNKATKQLNVSQSYKCQEKENNIIYCLDESGKPLTGKRELKNADGNWISIENFRKGHRNGLCTYFDKDGNYQERVYYKQGIKNGMDKIYYPNRSINVLANYKDGLLDGRIDVYYPNGKLKGRFTYSRGTLLNGTCVNARGKKSSLLNDAISSNSENTLYECGE